MQIISVIGRPCAGKGTQIKFLEEETGFPVVRTGTMLREKAKDDDILGRKIKEVFEKGLLHPTPFVFSIWTPFLLKIKESSEKGVIFDGNPRKLYEARMLEELFEALDWKDSWKVIYIDIAEEDSYERMKKRKREYDSEEDIKTRLLWFNEEVLPVIDYFEKKGALLRVDGRGSVEEVWERIKKQISA